MVLLFNTFIEFKLCVTHWNTYSVKTQLQKNPSLGYWVCSAYSWECAICWDSWKISLPCCKVADSLPSYICSASSPFDSHASFKTDWCSIEMWRWVTGMPVEPAQQEHADFSEVLHIKPCFYLPEIIYLSNNSNNMYYYLYCFPFLWQKKKKETRLNIYFPSPEIRNLLGLAFLWICIKLTLHKGINITLVFHNSLKSKRSSWEKMEL